MLIRLLLLVALASVAHSLITNFYAGHIYNGLMLPPNLDSVFLPKIVHLVLSLLTAPMMVLHILMLRVLNIPHPSSIALCSTVALLTVSVTVLVMLRVSNIPHPFLIVLCSVVALFSTAGDTFVGLACYSQPSFYLLNAIFYLFVYCIFGLFRNSRGKSHILWFTSQTGDTLLNPDKAVETNASNL